METGYRCYFQYWNWGLWFTRIGTCGAWLLKIGPFLFQKWVD